MEFAGNLRRFRRERGLTQKELAQKLGLSTSTIGGYESGQRKPDIKTLVRIAELFDMSVDRLLGIDDHRRLRSGHDDSHTKLEKQFMRLSMVYPQLPAIAKEMIHNMIDVILQQYENSS